MSKKNNVNLEKITYSIPDLKQYIDNDIIKVIPLKRHSKLPRDNGWNTKEYSINDLENYTGNFGIIPGYNHNTETGSLCIVDIDGLNGKYKKESQDYLFDCLKEIPGFLHVMTQSGGYHLYCFNKTVLDNFHKVSKNLCFPSDCPITELAGEGLGHSIEIFTKEGTKQCLLPGDVIYDKEHKQYNHYTVISAINRLTDIGTVDDISETIKDCLIDHGFTKNIDNECNVSSTKTDKTSNLKTLTSTELKTLTTYLTKLFRTVDGSKHYCSLYLGGYLSEHITFENCNKLCNSLIKSCGDLLLDKKAFKKTIIQNYQKHGNKAGLPTLANTIIELKPDFNLNKFYYTIRRACEKDYKHHIITSEGYNEKTELEICFNQARINNTKYKQIKDKETGEYHWVPNKTEPLLNIRPDRIYESYNILERNTPPKLCFKFYRHGMPYPNTLMGDNVLSIEKELETYSGVVLKPRLYKGVLNQLVAEYEKLGLLEQQFNAPVTGLFINPITDELEWCQSTSYECEDTGLIDIPSIKPSPQEVYNGLDVWKRLFNHYKGDLTKLSHILRWGLICPFSYILKQLQVYVPMIYLYGVSDTSKTMLAEISLCPYSSISDENSLAGLSVSSEYQAGNSFEKTSMGCVINEPGDVLDKPKILDLFKRGVESPICREKWDNIKKKHKRVPAYNNFIWTSNNYIPKQDAFIKRTDYIEFGKNEQMTPEDKELFVKEFNHVNWKNTDFLKLRSVGDFIVFYIHEHLDVLMLPHKELVDKLLDTLFEYSGHEPIKSLYETHSIMGFDETDNNILEELRLMILSDYSRNTRFIKKPLDETGNCLEDIGVTVSDTTGRGKDFKEDIIGLIESNRLPYLFINKNRDGELFIGFRGSTVGNSLNKFTNNDLQLSGKMLSELFGATYGVIKQNKTNKSIKGFKLSYDDFVEFIQ